MTMKTLFLIALLLIPAFGQHAVQPVRVYFTATTDDDGAEVADAVRARLKALGYVIATEHGPEWRVVLGAAKDKCGYIAALVVIDARGKSQLSIHTGDKVETLAAHLARKLETEYFKPKR